MNKIEKNAIAIYERELREQKVFDRWTYYRFAQRMIDQYPMLAAAALADKLQELARERDALSFNR